MPLKILVSGAGIAGTTLAFWLTRLGHTVTVVERYPSLRTTGLQLDLRGHGIEVLRLMGLEEAFRARAVSERGLQIVDKTGRRRGFFPVHDDKKDENPGTKKEVQNFSSEFEIMRGDLCRLLCEAAEDKATYIYGTWIERMEQRDEGGVEVTFNSARTERFDLLVGADGQWSKTRRMMLGAGVPDPIRPLGGDYIGYFTMADAAGPEEEHVATMYMGTRRRNIMTRRHDPHQIQVYFLLTTEVGPMEAARAQGVDAEKRLLADIYRGAGWRSDDFIRGLLETDNFYCEHTSILRMDAWSRGSVALVGDAAYCPSANTGMGTTSGVVGAYVLAGEIGKHCGQVDAENNDRNPRDGLAAALAAYEQKFRPFMNQVQKGISDKGSNFDGIPSTPFVIGIFNCLISLASMLKLNFGKMFLKENVKGWDLPQYDEMLKK